MENTKDDVKDNEDDVKNNKDDVEKNKDDVEKIQDPEEKTENTIEKKHAMELKECYILKGGYRLVKRRKRAALRYVHYHPEKDREHHFREILMLFRPWREENNIIRVSNSYEEEFQKAEEEVCEKMKEYNYYSDALEKAMKDLKNMEEENLEEEWNKNAPNTQYAEKKDEEEGSKPSDTFPEFQPEEENQKANDMSSELGGGGEDSGPPDIIANMMPEEDYFRIIRSLNTKQREIFMYVLNKVKTQSTPFHIFITGGAGVGKSVVISAIHQAVLRFLNKGAGNNPDEAKVLLGAPTGIAAFLIGGGTLHSLFHIPANQDFSYKPLTSDVLNTYQCKYRHLKLLVIDEISMVGNKMLNYINRRLQQIMGSSDMFGGLSVIAVGDLFQLKPVFDGWIFKDLANEYSALALNIWKDHFAMFELDQVMRQKDNAEFANILNRLRIGQQTEMDIRVLKERLINKDISAASYPLSLPHIFTKNEDVRAHNNKVHDMSPQMMQISINCSDVVIGDVLPEVKTKILNTIPSDPAKTMGLLKKLETAIGQRVEMCCNVDVEDGLVNGAGGEVKENLSR